MLDVLLIRGEARRTVLDELHRRGYEPLIENDGCAAWSRQQPDCDACCAAATAVAVLEEMHAQSDQAVSLHEFVMNAVEKPLIERALERTNGNQVAAARLLGIHRNTLRSKIRLHEIQLPGR